MTWTLREVVGLLLASLAVWTSVGFAAGRWARARLLDQVHDDAYEMGWSDARQPRSPEETRPVTVIAGEAETVAEFIAAPLEPGHYRMYDEHLSPAALEAAADVSRPGGVMEGPEVPEREGDVPGQAVIPRAGPGHQTPAQRRRDKHKQRGQDAPDPEAEPVSIDWTGELAAIRVNGQTDWFTEMMAQVA